MARQKTVSTPPTALLSVADVALLLGVCRQTVYSYMYREGLPSISVRGIRRIRWEALDSWLKEHEQCLDDER